MLHKKIIFMSLLLLSVLFISVNDIFAQDTDLYNTFRWRNIGPANMTGRVSDVEALESNFRVVLVGSASGGVFKSTNAGMTWDVIFDKYGSCSIGDVAFYQKDPNVIWVGTGEANNRNSSGWGDGIYKSSDGGKTFENMGLKDTHQIARIITHPTNRNIVYVAAPGHLWGYSGTRGLFKTINGGKTWTILKGGLPEDGKTGCTDLVIDPNNPNTLYAAMYQRIRKGWTFQSGGSNGGIYKTTDGGKTWQKLTNNLPKGDIGRIGLDIYKKNPNIIVANIEADENIPEDMNIPGPGVYRSENGGRTWKYLFRHVSRPFYFGQVRIHPNDDNKIYLLYRIAYMSKDGGGNFGPLFRGVYGDPHAMWIDPKNNGVMYFGDDGGVHLSHDSGGTWMKFDNMAIGQYYAIGVDMQDPYWVYGGLQDQNVWGTPSSSRDQMGVLNDHVYNVSGGDGFHTQIDPTDWRTVYSVAHVGYAGRSNAETRERKFISPMPENIRNFEDFAKPDYNETPTVYTIDPGEEWLWRDMPSRSINGNILPAHFRFNWSSPLVMSPNNPRTIYFGSNYLFKSTDRGDSWTIISPDLTTNDPDKRNPSGDGGLTVDVTGAENHCTIITISESHVNPDVVWVGTDDGNVQVTRNGGVTWTNTRAAIPDLPEVIWCSRVEASHFEEGTAYISMDGHRDDDFNPYIYKTNDFGQTWTRITNGMENGHSVYVVKEDNVNPNLLFTGTEFGAYVTVDQGENWTYITQPNNLPTVAIHDLVIHPRDADVIAGTHGRSLWIMDDITPLQQLTDEVRESDLYLFKSRTGTIWQNISRGGHRGAFMFRGENAPGGVSINYFMKNAVTDKVEITVSDIFSGREQTFRGSGNAGINNFRWNMQFRLTADDRDNHKIMLMNALNSLLQAGLNNSERQKLGEVLNELNMVNTGSSRSGRVLSQIRNKMIENFRHYAGGTALDGSAGLFGDPLLRSIQAAPGTYKVTIKSGDFEVSGNIKIRKDPILDK